MQSATSDTSPIGTRMVVVSDRSFLEILSRERIIGCYFGPGYNSWDSVQDWMCAHPRGRGLCPGTRHYQIYQACRQYQAERSRSKSWRPRPPLTSD